MLLIIQKFNATIPGDSLLPGNKNPDWLTFSGEGPFVIFDVPNVTGRKLKSVMLCIVYSSSSNNVSSEEGPIIKNLCIINHTKTTPFLYDGDTLASLSDEEWQKVISNLQADDKVQIVVASGLGFTVKKTAVYLIYAAENMNVHDVGENHLDRIRPVAVYMRSKTCSVDRGVSKEAWKSAPSGLSFTKEMTTDNQAPGSSQCKCI
ncbi:hypothetical protein PIB30_001781 [Stylosanthes scabra]|uniref:Uncharacterized protein n=1 Tax=Stylosanthes scabra TaxID=79078 RepID=A0ABU6V1Y9_9FABA|nr:hypothetical protein [Stylosanthes scabra]